MRSHFECKLSSHPRHKEIVVEVVDPEFKQDLHAPIPQIRHKIMGSGSSTKDTGEILWHTSLPKSTPSLELLGIGFPLCHVSCIIIKKDDMHEALCYNI